MIPHFVIPWIFFGFLLLIATLFEKRNPVAPAPMRAVIIDWKIALLRNVGNQLSSPVTAGIMFVSAMMGGGLIHLRSDGWWFPVSIVVIMLSIDFVSYWIHRTQHAWPMLWAMHSLHHSAVSLTVMTGARHFWLEDIYIRLVYFFSAMH